jgi:hypothetical protein
MYKQNYTESSTLPDWLLDAGDAKAVTGEIKDRAARYLKEHLNTLSQEEDHCQKKGDG